MKPKKMNRKLYKKFLLERGRNGFFLATLGLLGITTGCNTVLPLSSEAKAQTKPTSTATETATPLPTATTPWPTATATLTPSPTITPWPTPTSWATPTPWPTPGEWVPIQPSLPALATIPVIPPTATALPIVIPDSSGGLIPASYSPPDGVDVFGSTVLRWHYPGQLAADEYFDIKIKPFGQEESVFVDWSKSNEYTLHSWSGWQPGLYTWQIGIVKGYLDGDTKHFIADTGRDSQPAVIKWQTGGQGGGNGGGGGYGGGNGGGGNTGGS